MLKYFRILCAPLIVVSVPAINFRFTINILIAFYFHFGAGQDWGGVFLYTFGVRKFIYYTVLEDLE